MLIFVNYFSFVLLCVFLIGCSDNKDLQPFSSDGCSLFPDHSIISNSDWCECCFRHDLAYWQGGTKEQREFADLNLKQCVLEKTGDNVLADIMYRGVRFGGSPYFYNWYRWGYGWSYERKYEPLNQQEKILIEKRKQEFNYQEIKSGCEPKN